MDYRRMNDICLRPELNFGVLHKKQVGIKGRNTGSTVQLLGIKWIEYLNTG